MKKSILILGGTGFIGLNIAAKLSKEFNNQITLCDNFSRGNRDEEVNHLLEKSNVNLIEADFTNKESWDLLEEYYDQVYMLASVVGVGNTLEYPHEVIRINTALIMNTLEWLSKGTAGKVVFTSTSENYAGTIDYFNYEIPTPEDIPLTIVDVQHPRFTYALTKILGESGFSHYSKAYGFDFAVVRYHNVYGPRMGFKHVIPHLVERFRDGESPFQIYGADQTRAFCYIDDAVDATVLVMEECSGESEIYHIGTEDEITIESLVHQVGKLMGYSGIYEHAPTYPGSTRRRCPSIKKAKERLGYKPKIDLATGLSLTVKWYQSYLMKSNPYESSFKKP